MKKYLLLIIGIIILICLIFFNFYSPKITDYTGKFACVRSNLIDSLYIHSNRKYIQFLINSKTKSKIKREGTWEIDTTEKDKEFLILYQYSLNEELDTTISENSMTMYRMKKHWFSKLKYIEVDDHLYLEEVK